MSVGGGAEEQLATAVRYGGRAGAGHYRVYGKFFQRDAASLAGDVDAPDGRRLGQGGFRADWDRSSDSFTLQGDVYRSTKDPFPGGDRIRAHGANVLARWTRRSSSRSELQLQSYIDRTHRYAPNQIAEDRTTWDLDMQQRWTASARHTVSFGGSYRISADRTVASTLLAFEPANRVTNLFGGFVQDEIALSRTVMAIAGVKVERNDYTGVEWLIVLLFSSAAAVLFMSRLQRQLTEPLRQLADTAQAVSNDRNYDRRVHKEADDEVGAVAEAFNDMLSRVQARDEELQNALELKDEFLATVSHELRTPLNAMLGWSHVLRDPQVTPEMTRQAVEAIDRNARWQARLIEDILDVSRIITGKLRLEPRPTDLAAIVMAAVDVVKPSADAKRIAIETTLPAFAGFVGDSDRLRQVVWNILSNAVKFTPQNGRITVTLTEQPGEYALEVTDNGRGISPDFVPFIFQPFRQAEGSTTRSQGGLGLGLAIARHLTELSGGSIHAASEGLNRGATFTIRLPRQAGMPRGTVGEERSTMTERWSDLEDYHVLVVDDNEDTRNVLATMLEAHGATVTIAASVADARASFTHRVPDVLITDLAMPVEDGFGLLEYCRHHADPQLRSLPILALTAYGGQQAHDRVVAAGFDAYLAKPVEPVEVGRVVRDLATRTPSSTRREAP